MDLYEEPTKYLERRKTEIEERITELETKMDGIRLDENNAVIGEVDELSVYFMTDKKSFDAYMMIMIKSYKEKLEVENKEYKLKIERAEENVKIANSFLLDQNALKVLLENEIYDLNSKMVKADSSIKNELIEKIRILRVEKNERQELINYLELEKNQLNLSINNKNTTMRVNKEKIRQRNLEFKSLNAKKNKDYLDSKQLNMDIKELQAAKIFLKQIEFSINSLENLEIKEKPNVLNNVDKKTPEIPSTENKSILPQSENITITKLPLTEKTPDLLNLDKLNPQPELDELAQAKIKAKESLSIYNNLLYKYTRNVSSLIDEINAGEKNIEKALDLESVERAFSNSKSVIDAIKTDDQIDLDELTQAKIEAEKVLYNYKNISDYKNNIDALINATTIGERFIEEALDLEEISVALSNAKIALDGIEADIQEPDLPPPPLNPSKQENKEWKMDGFKLDFIEKFHYIPDEHDRHINKNYSGNYGELLTSKRDYDRLMGEERIVTRIKSISASFVDNCKAYVSKVFAKRTESDIEIDDLPVNLGR